jgi:hypothetical protein
MAGKIAAFFTLPRDRGKHPFTSACIPIGMTLPSTQ